MALIYMKFDDFDQAKSALHKSYDYNRNTLKEEISQNYFNYLYDDHDIKRKFDFKSVRQTN